MSPKPISSRGSSTIMGRFGGVMFGAFFAGIGTLFLVFAIIMLLIPYLKAQSWQETNCKILSAKIESHQGDDGTTYSPEFTFELRVDGQKYTGKKYSTNDYSSSKSYAQGVLDQYPVGSETTCFYDPDDPSNAVLNRDFSWFTLIFLLFPLPFIAIGLAVMYFSFRGKGASDVRKQMAEKASDDQFRSDSLAAKPAGNSGLNHPDDLKDAEWSVPKKLKPKQTRLGAALALLIFCLIWNGVVSAFVFFMISDPPGGWQKYLIWLFLTPFMLIGLVMILVFITSVMKLFNPVVEIAISSGAVPLGGSVDIAWEVQGRVGAIKSLIIKIKGEESAQYRRGTSTYTDESTFALIDVSDVNQQHEIQFGSSSVTIPDDTMHSVDLGHNEIKWSIEIHGVIGLWPDIKESYPFRVKPS